MWYGMGWGGMWFGWVVLAVILIMVGWFISRIATGSSIFRERPLENEKPLDILKKRYARGEIDKRRFEAMKKDLE